VRVAIVVAAILGLVIVVWYGGVRLFGASEKALLVNRRLSADQNDERVLAALRVAGSDITKPTAIVFYLYIPALRDATAAASVLRTNGLTVRVHQPLGKLPDGSYESRYSVVANAEEVPSMKNLRRDRALFLGLVRRYGGDYDGWEAQIAR